VGTTIKKQSAGIHVAVEGSVMQGCASVAVYHINCKARERERKGSERERERRERGEKKRIESGEKGK